MALDATLLDPNGRELDMGTGFDEMTELSHPQLRPGTWPVGDLTPAQHRNRELLRTAHAGGFNGINNEWWRFEMGDRQEVARAPPSWNEETSASGRTPPRQGRPFFRLPWKSLARIPCAAPP